MTYTLVIVTPDGEKFRGKAKSLTVRTGSGDMEILAGHVSCLASVATGRARVCFEDDTERFASASGGILTVNRGEVELICTTFEWADEIDLARAEAARQKAAEALVTKLDERDHSLAKAKLQRALCRIDVAKSK
jgi:F-type H+-transporting ATPase subunit epsilon